MDRAREEEIPQPVSDVFRHQMEAQRNRLRLTQAGFSDKLARLGFHLDRSVIAKIENGSRPARIREAVAIAFALDTSPLYLLTPTGSHPFVKLSDTIEIPPALFEQWLSGGGPLPEQNEDRFELSRPEQILRLERNADVPTATKKAVTRQEQEIERRAYEQAVAILEEAEQRKAALRRREGL